MPPPSLPTNTTGKDDDDYVSPYATTTTDERLRRSVLAAMPDGGGGAFSRRGGGGGGGVFRPMFEGEAFLSAVGMVGGVVEGVLVREGGRGDGGDRVTNSLYGPLENLACMLEAFGAEVEAWANKPKYFKEVSVPFIVRTIETSTSEASTLKKLRRALKFAGPIDSIYVNSFDPFVRALEEPILELRAVGEFIEGVLRGESRSGSIGEAKGLKSSTTTTMVGRMGGESVRGGVGGSGGEVREKVKTSSKYFDTILNPEPATQASSTSGDVRMEESAAGEEDDDGMGSSAFADLSRAAGYLVPDSQDMESRSPRHETEPVDVADAGSPSYSPPASPSPSPSLSFETLLKHTDPPATTPSSILSNPTATYAPNAQRTILPPASSGKVQTWKLDLHARKGHPIRLLHAGPRQLAILTRCRELVQTATRTGEECVRRIEELKALSGEMRGEREQWVEFCADLEGNVMMEDGDEDGKGDRDDVARAYGRLDDRDGVGEWGYRKFDNPAPKRQRRQHLQDIDEDGDEDAETDVEDWRRAKRTDHFGPRPRSARIQGPPSPSPSPSSPPSTQHSPGHDDTRAGTAKQKPAHPHSYPRSKDRKRGNRARGPDAKDGYDPDREVEMADADIGIGARGRIGDADGDEMEWESTDDDGSTEHDGSTTDEKDEDEKGKKGLLRSAGGGVVGLYGEGV